MLVRDRGAVGPHSREDISVTAKLHENIRDEREMRDAWPWHVCVREGTCSVIVMRTWRGIAQESWAEVILSEPFVSGDNANIGVVLEWSECPWNTLHAAWRLSHTRAHSAPSFFLCQTARTMDLARKRPFHYHCRTDHLRICHSNYSTFFPHL